MEISVQFFESIDSNSMIDLLIQVELPSNEFNLKFLPNPILLSKLSSKIITLVSNESILFASIAYYELLIVAHKAHLGVHPQTSEQKSNQLQTFSTDFPFIITCLLYTSDAADEEDSVAFVCSRIYKKKKTL
eukprot:TRINITY_DN8601_c0_g1_i1.p1 TRINITY_DN8601_c0_g1~~TRINITY_DN8601_c0_g1_i1.p1  ORF type:complete len:132 (+),score=13.19 TRINITY_DN8601_c0_g1_i1:164-559(+)